MKILRFDLIAFGHFTDQSLDLSAGQEGIHLIYGPNEAGKSTALRALRAAFYGIDPRSGDNFVHEHERMRVGARIRHSDGSECEFIRRKGIKNTFLDAQGKPAEETPLGRCLAGVDAHLFGTLFGIDHQQLVLGGENILKGRGDVGQSLFAAGLGAVSLRDVLDRLDNEAGELFRPQGHNQAINRAVKKYTETRKQIADQTLFGREYEERLAAVEAFRRERDRITAELQRVRAETIRLDRIRRALAPIAERRRLLDELGEIGEVVALPPEFSGERVRLVAQLQNALASAERCAKKITELDDKIAGLPVPQQLLQYTPLIAGLHQRLGSHLKAALDLPGLQGELLSLEADAKRLIEEIRPGFPLEHVESLRLGRAGRLKIHDLGNQHQALAERPIQLQDAIETARGRLASATIRLETFEPVREAGGLAAIIRSAQGEGDIESELDRQRIAVATAREKAALDLGRLGLWCGTLEELERLPIPTPETAGRFEDRWISLQNEIGNLVGRIAESENRLANDRRELEELLRSGAVPSEWELEESRRWRDMGWRLVRKAWLEGEKDAQEARVFAGEKPLADAFEASMEDADNIADRLRREADRVAKRASLTASHEQCAKGLDVCMESLERRKSEILELEQSWATLWQPITPLPPREMRPWIQKQLRLVEQAADIRTRSRLCDDLERRIAIQRELLRDALIRLGDQPRDEPLALLIEHGQRVIEAINQYARKRDQIERDIAALTENVRTLEEQKQQAARALREWQSDWKTAVCELGLPETAAPSQANAILDGFDELFRKLDHAAKLKGRIEGILGDAKAFQQDVARAVELMAQDLKDVRPEEAVTKLHTRHTRASKDFATREALEKQRNDAAHEMEETHERIQAVSARLETMCRQARCERYDELEAIERKSARMQTARGRLEELEQRLLAESAGLGIAEFIREAEAMDGDALQAQIADNHRLVAEFENKRSEIDAQLGADEALLKTKDGTSRAAEAAEQLQRIAAEIQDRAERYVRVRLAAAILRAEIEHYRAENQHPLLARASEFFRQLTRNSFAAITADFDAGDEPTLRGVRPSGAHVAVNQMSEGSRDQLFFALQLASVERFVESTEPMPFIVDDVLIGFDDERAAAVLRALEALSRKTQVIMFTHHRHLVELARGVLPDNVLRLHELRNSARGSFPAA